MSTGAYLRHPTSRLVRSLLGEPGPVEFHLDLASVGLDQGIPCGLIVNELVSNALRHGFPADFDPRAGTGS